jgi:hypothetical protein
VATSMRSRFSRQEDAIGAAAGGSTACSPCSSAGSSALAKALSARSHLDYYLDEFTFRFNRRRSKSRGKLFFRLAQQAVAADPVSYDRIVRPSSAKAKPQSVAAT